MKKVKYSITRYCRKGSFRFFGYGETDGEDLITEYIRDGEKVQKVYEDCIRYLHPVPNHPDEFKGGYYDFETIEVEDDKGRINEIEIEVSYQIWIKYIKEGAENV